MLSIENSSDPSCSSSKASDLVSGTHEDQPRLAPKFSIRDYVFRARSKDIRISWPFHEQLLQLCLDSAITDLLPPLQSRGVVKSHCIENKTVFVNGEPKDDVDLEPSYPLDSSVLIPKEKRKLKVKLTRSESENNASSLTSHISSKEILGDQFINNKCRLAEDLVSNSSTVSDPMASKMCPVCKLFTSSSNTTLNAHIDQCLSSDQSNATKDTTHFFKPKVKPRKKRLMMDIYKTARHCTLEDLDRRNGTHWAGGLAVAALANDANLEPERPKFLPLDMACKGNVGDIYVDSNGTKLLILSKLDASPQLVSRKSFKLKKHGKGYTAIPSCSFPKKNTKKPKCSKLMKVNPQSRKSSVVKRFKGEIVAATEIEHATEDHQEKDECLSHRLNAHDQVKNSAPSTLGHWVCSKRSNLTRELVNNDTNKGSENMIVTTGNISFKRTQRSKGHSSVERVCALNLPSSPESAVPPKFKGMDIPFEPSKTCKLLGEGDCLHSSPQPSRPNKCDLPSSDGRKSLTLKMSMPLVGMKVDMREKLTTPKKFKKRRSILACSKWRGGEKYSDANGASHGLTKDFDLISSRANQTSEIHLSNLSEYQEGCLVTKDPMRNTDFEHVESISRDKILVELPTQRSSDNQEVQCCENMIGNEVLSRDIQISVDHAEPTVQAEEIQECNPCFNSGRDMALETTQENTSTTSISVKPNRDCNRIVDIEVSGCSEVSNSSTISRPSPVHDNGKDFKADRFSSLTAGQDDKVKSSPSPRESSCSCGESLSRESQLSNPTRETLSSNMFMKLPTQDFSKSCCQPASNPVLRLMGKDLVVNKEESMQAPKILPCGTNYTSEAEFISFGVPHNVGFVGYNNCNNCQMQTVGDHQFPNPPLMFAQHQHWPKPAFPSCQEQELIVIDDDSQGIDSETRTNYTTLPLQTVQNSNIMAPQRLFACIPALHPYASTVFTSSQRGTPEGYFIFPSPSSLYVTPSFR